MDTGYAYRNTCSTLRPFGTNKQKLRRIIMTKINPYLSFKGNCEEAFNFYKSVFGGEFGYIGRYKDVPQPDRQIFAQEADEKIMHVSLPISTETVLMGCDTAEAFGESIVEGNNFSLSINTDSKEKADRLFHALSAGGEVKMQMNQTFWGSYFGVLVDQFGINWTISFESQNQ
jgi:PhnB protein